MVKTHDGCYRTMTDTEVEDIELVRDDGSYTHAVSLTYDKDDDIYVCDQGHILFRAKIIDGDLWKWSFEWVSENVHQAMVECENKNLNFNEYFKSAKEAETFVNEKLPEPVSDLFH